MGPVVVCKDALRYLVDILNGRAACFPAVVLCTAALIHEGVHFPLFKIFRHTQKPRCQCVLFSHCRVLISFLWFLLYASALYFATDFWLLSKILGGALLSVYKNAKIGKWMYTKKEDKYGILIKRQIGGEL